MAERNIQQDSKYLYLPYFCEIKAATILSTASNAPKRIVDKWDEICNIIKDQNKIVNDMIVFSGNFWFGPSGSAQSAGNWFLWGIIAPQYSNAGTIFATHYGNLQEIYVIKHDNIDGFTIQQINTTSIPL